ncbi:MFS transporter [Brevibacillus choshinensis]|uniref:MFS transporter n=1 Tax=Brevibacillus choshinensis TaxID=54911 RepID=A0ABX7FHC6_BRECH|nr:MFS transporter [Brevibacillus choshinensis]QRG65623.1 MFS transporter [Brevibacillus choshinensis]
MHHKTKTGFPAILHNLRQSGKNRVHPNEKVHKRGHGQLDAQAKLLLFVNLLFITAGALSGTFVNVYLWKVKSQFAPIAWFTFATYLASALTFWLAGAWVKRFNKMNVLRAGMAVSALFYLLVLMLGTKVVAYSALLGLVQGMANGFFWLSFNVVYFEITERDNRDRFNGWAGLLASGGGMLAPWISGYLISRMTDVRGYTLIFTISLVLFVVGVVISFFLKKRQSQGDYAWSFAIHSLREDTNWRWAFGALAGQGLREGVFGFVIGLLVYIATKSEMTLGNYWLITSAVGLGSYYIVGKWLKPHYRKWGMFCGALVMSAVVSLFFWKVSYVTLLIFGVAVSLAYPLFSVPIISTVFDLIGTNEESAKNRVEYVVLREFGLDAGRLTGILIFLVVTSFSTSPSTLNWLILLIGTGPLIAWFCMKRLFSRVSPPPASEKN